MTQTALVTGGAGFVGSHLVDSLLGDGYRVVVLDDLSTGSAKRLDPKAELEVADLVDRPAVDRLADQIKPETIFHLGAQSSVTVSVTDPGRDCAVNVQGTLNVLEAARRLRSPVVFTSTGGALYGNEAPLPTPEDYTPGPVSPYGASKWAGEAYVRTWAVANDVPHAVCRLGNVYGPRQSPHGEAGVVAIFAYSAWAGRSPTLYGDGAPTRDYVHVRDVVRALRSAAGTPGVFNVATGVETTVREVFDRVTDAAGSNVPPKLAPLRPGELARSCMDSSRARERLGWRPQVSLAEGIAETYDALANEFAASLDAA